MHPAPSVIIFNTFSGIGFGLLFFLGLGFPAPTGWVAFVFFAIAYIMAVGGLIASTFHLGHPERAIKAFSQWRTSWLSREGICAVAALIIMAIYGAGLVFFGTKLTILGWVGAVLSLGVVYTTSMIYAQMKTVPRWKHWSTPALFIDLSVAGGALLSGNIVIALIMLVIAGGMTAYYWATGDKRFAESGSNLANATGLGGIGSVRAFEPPHTGSNYLLKEFAFEVGRKHVQKLRIISMVFGFAIPFVLLLMVQASASHILALFAVISHIVGVLALRWLFFAQAEHVVGLYYGKR
ncbi:DMSO reductase anchor subunit [Cognatiyoonia sediminum]|uniref:DMSO reductase anchor subunit n=1 Tax=Cognatiyoonia sediminum TaxID=1508389 RepID=A0A1M5PN38_9RHOB|nr:DmsC/YnfH family molybdoenzyme membrane anchor subunit [Cognatiyoonia sediminum]SHH03215.1 DMSO reductase anchor subunit [Cognatiyoonia sediminum]